ncbi:MAG: YceI family protein [Bdellovibrionota bacterium]
MLQALVILLTFTRLALASEWTRFEVRDAAQRDIVQFTSDAPLEKVIGVNSSLRGWVALDPNNLSKGVQGEFEVDMRTFDTGMLLRNEHFRTQFLETSQYPFSTFKIDKLVQTSSSKLGTGQTVLLKTEGTLKIKAVSKSIPVDLKLVFYKENKKTRERLEGNLLRISARFAVDISDFGVFWNEDLALRLTKKVRIQVDALGSDAAAPLYIPQAESQSRAVADAIPKILPKKRPRQMKKR